MNKILSLLLLSIFVFSVNSFAQSIKGNVVEVLDGMNLIIEDHSKTRFAVQLQHIEIPAPEFPISITIKEHLQKLTLGKSVEFELNSVNQEKQIGKVSVIGADVSKQMLRDGAAWYRLPQAAIQPSDERAEYRTLENAAKDEKRGLWGIAGVKSIRELKVEQDEKVAEQERLAEEDRVLKVRIKRAEDARRANANMQFWPDVPVGPPAKRPSTSGWDWIANSSANEFYISRKRITEDSPGTLNAWLMVIPRTDTEAGKQGKQSYVSSLALSVGIDRAEKFSHYENLREYNCAGRKTRDLNVVFYDADGTVLRQLEGLKNWSPSAPDSLNSALLKAICK